MKHLNFLSSKEIRNKHPHLSSYPKQSFFSLAVSLPMEMKTPHQTLVKMFLTTLLLLGSSGSVLAQTFNIVIPTDPPVITAEPSPRPTLQPSPRPTSQPTFQLTSQPTSQPTLQPTVSPTTSLPTTSAPTTSSPTGSPTLFPTRSSTLSPTMVSTDTPSKSPTPLNSKSPTTMPSIYKRVSVIGQAQIMLAPVSSLLMGDIEQVFLEYTIAFLTQELPLDNVTVEIVRQARQQRRRTLQAEEEGALFMNLRVTASHIVTDLGEALFLDEALYELFDTKEADFVAMLQLTGDDYFSKIVRAGIPETLEPTAKPTAAPNDAKPFEAREGGDDEEGLILGIAEENFIIIVVGATLGLGLLIGLVYIFFCKKEGKQYPSKRGNRGGTWSMSNNKKKKYHTQISESVSDLEAKEAFNSPVAPSSDGQSSYYGGSIMQVSTQMDTNSYSYSLEPGLEASVISGAPSSTSIGRPVPMEIPQLQLPSVGERQNKKVIGQSVVDESFQISLSTSDLQLTDSELAILPSNLADSKEGEEAIAKYTKVVIAPAGKLGIIIDTTVEGPVVHKVNPGSALEGQVQSGDVIIAIEDTDTRAMSALSITSLMVQTAGQERKLTIVSNPN